MRRGLPKVVLAIVAILALGACQDPDVGGSCLLSWNPNWEADGTPPPPKASELFLSGGSDYFESGNLACEGLVCIVSPADPDSPSGDPDYGDRVAGEGYCSKPCVSNDDCFRSDTDLVCRQMVLDPVFLEQLDPETRARYLSDIQFSSYCAVPR